MGIFLGEFFTLSIIDFYRRKITWDFARIYNLIKIKISWKQNILLPLIQFFTALDSYFFLHEVVVAIFLQDFKLFSKTLVPFETHLI